jgi:hypothetical protein
MSDDDFFGEEINHGLLYYYYDQVRKPTPRELCEVISNDEPTRIYDDAPS